jgi:hypothetical protein
VVLALDSACASGGSPAHQPRGEEDAGAKADAAGEQETIDCAAACARVAMLCRGVNDVSDVWQDACRTSCRNKALLAPERARTEVDCVAVAAQCESAVVCVADLAGERIDAGGSQQAGGDAGAAEAPAMMPDLPDAAGDEGSPSETGPAFVKATIDGVPVVFDVVTRHTFVGWRVYITAQAPASHRTIDIYIYESKSATSSSQADFCDFQGNSSITLTDESGASPRTYKADDRTSGSMCAIRFTTFAYPRVAGTFSATLVGGTSKLTLTDGYIDVPVR